MLLRRLKTLNVPQPIPTGPREETAYSLGVTSYIRWEEVQKRALRGS